MSRWEIIEADVVEALRGMADDSIDGCLTDVPYGLGSRAPTVDEIVAYLTAGGAMAHGDFMNKKWEIPPVAFWKELCRVLKPGAHVLTFAGTRTMDLIMLGMRAGGFEIRDSIGCAMPSEGPGILSWCYASGFPKSLDVSKAIDDANGDEREIVSETVGRWKYANNEKSGAAYGDESRATDEDGYLISKKTAPASPASAAFAGYGTALAPAWEPIVLARKPLAGTVARTALTYGTGGLAIDASRVGWGDEKPSQDEWNRKGSTGAAGGNGFAGQFNQGLKDAYAAGAVKVSEGRWPKNVLLVHDPRCVRTGRGSDGLEEVAEYSCVPTCPCAILDAQSGDDHPGMSGGGTHREGYAGGMFGGIDSADTARGDDGAASRFYQQCEYTEVDRFSFVAKASRSEREFGCDALPARTAVDREEGSPGVQSPRAGAGRTASEIRNIGPCVKPIALTRYLSGLIKPPARSDGKPLRIVCPYAGTGSEMIGALRAGWDEAIGIQRISDDDEKAYVAIARARLARWDQVPASMGEADAVRESRTVAKETDVRQRSLFDALNPEAAAGQ